MLPLNLKKNDTTLLAYRGIFFALQILNYQLQRFTSIQSTRNRKGVFIQFSDKDCKQKCGKTSIKNYKKKFSDLIKK